MIRQPVTSLQLPLLILTLISILMLSSRTVVSQSPASPPSAQGAASAANSVEGQNSVPSMNSENDATYYRLAGAFRCFVYPTESTAESHAVLPRAF